MDEACQKGHRFVACHLPPDEAGSIAAAADRHACRPGRRSDQIFVGKARRIARDKGWASRRCGAVWLYGCWQRVWASSHEE
ncbi:hypothetical protein E2P81_ATG07901 [Venturia nashicola]|uniref:Uncharacterized protein n=1 Tax=Venturia nashicola TaxID=86259 RepID=A0A4Z1NZZ5_9PEZI|nr:hypothetical protein E6O75_ATG08071 [Venturia nashicola]TLD26089.1 hypothetical protein E2P81_ATG07901 [Venturia nashicola]